MHYFATTTGYHMFTNANEKFTNTFVEAFSLVNPATDWKKFHATTSLIQMLLALAHQIISA